MGFREIKSTPIFNDSPEIPFVIPLRPVPTPTKPVPAPEPEPEIVPTPTPPAQPKYNPQVRIEEVLMEPMPAPALNSQPQQAPQRQFIPFTPPQPTPTAQRTITLPSFSLNRENAKKYGIALVKFSLAAVMIWIGITTTGSYFGPASGKFSGQLAQVFYQFQLGTLVACCGLILAYDAIQKLR
jgi:hypothetical protein